MLSGQDSQDVRYVLGYSSMPDVSVERKAAALRQLKKRLREFQVDEEVFGDYLLNILCDAITEESDRESSFDNVVELLVSACNDVSRWWVLITVYLSNGQVGGALSFLVCLSFYQPLFLLRFTTYG